jgi:subtilisin family serine protease
MHWNRTGLLRRLAICAGVAMAATAIPATVAEAQFRGGFRANTTIVRAPTIMHGPRLHGGGLQTFNGAPRHESGHWGRGAETGAGTDSWTDSRTDSSTGTWSNTRTDTPTNAWTAAKADKASSGRDGIRRRPPRGKRPPQLRPPAPVTATAVVVAPQGPAGGAAPPPVNKSDPPARRGGIDVPPGNEHRFVEDQVLLEFARNAPPRAVAGLLARHGLTQLERRSFALTGSTVVLARVPDLRSVRVTLSRLGGEAVLRAGQPNYLYEGSRSSRANVTAAVSPGTAFGDSAQYALGKLRLNEAHALANGDRIVIAVIDSGIDGGHPELRGVVVGSYDVLGKAEKPHPHGTGIAGVIAAHARLVGAAPAARILAIRAFGNHGVRSAATTFAILKSLDHAASHRARVVNMSFTGPADPGLARQLAATARKGIVLVAAAGNFGADAPPQYPAADPNVIAVSATDANDQRFTASNGGPHITVAAPGVDILVPAPDGGYQLASGTSYAAAHVSGVVALVLQRAPGLSPAGVRRILESTAQDLGPRGKDRQFGAGLVDAYRAVTAVPSATAGAPQAVRRPVLAQ